METEVKKRVNFTSTEKEILLSIIAQYEHIIEDKCTKASSIENKNKAWYSVAYDYNCLAETGSRTAKQLKMCYENMKKREAMKKKAAEQQTNNTANDEDKDYETKVMFPLSGDYETKVMLPLSEEHETKPILPAPEYYETEISINDYTIKMLPRRQSEAVKRKKKYVSCEYLRQLYYQQKIKNERKRSIVLELKAEILRLQIKKLKQLKVI